MGPRCRSVPECDAAEDPSPSVSTPLRIRPREDTSGDVPRSAAVATEIRPRGHERRGGVGQGQEPSRPGSVPARAKRIAKSSQRERSEANREAQRGSATNLPTRSGEECGAFGADRETWTLRSKVRGEAWSAWTRADASGPRRRARRERSERRARGWSMQPGLGGGGSAQH